MVEQKSLERRYEELIEQRAAMKGDFGNQKILARLVYYNEFLVIMQEWLIRTNTRKCRKKFRTSVAH